MASKKAKKTLEQQYIDVMQQYYTLREQLVNRDIVDNSPRITPITTFTTYGAFEKPIV